MFNILFLTGKTPSVACRQKLGVEQTQQGVVLKSLSHDNLRNLVQKYAEKSSKIKTVKLKSYKFPEKNPTITVPKDHVYYSDSMLEPVLDFMLEHQKIHLIFPHLSEEEVRILHGWITLLEGGGLELESRTQIQCSTMSASEIASSMSMPEMFFPYLVEAYISGNVFLAMRFMYWEDQLQQQKQIPVPCSINKERKEAFLKTLCPEDVAVEKAEEKFKMPETVTVGDFSPAFSLGFS